MNGWLWLTPAIAALGGWVAGTVLKRRMLHIFSQQLKVLSHSLRSGMSKPTARPVEPEASHFEEIRPFMEEQADQFFRYRLVAAMPMVGMLIGEKTILQMKEVLMKELEELFPVVIDKYLRITEGAAAHSGAPSSPPENLPPEPVISPDTPVDARTRDALARPFRRLPLRGFLFGLVVGGLQLLFLALALR